MQDFQRGESNTMTDNREMVEIDLKRLFRVLWSKAWVILIVGVLVAALAFGYAWFFQTPMYSSNVRLYVNNNYANSPGFSSSQIVAAQDLADTYMVIMRSRDVLSDVAEQTGLPYTYKQLLSMIDAAAVNDTEVFQVNVTCADAEHAAQLANAIADILPAKIATVVEGSSVRVVDYAVVNDVQVSPNYQKYALLGFLLGGVLSAALVVVLDVLDTSISSEEYLSQMYNEFPLLAVIPDSQSTGNSGYYKNGYYENRNKPQTSRENGGGRK